MTAYITILRGINVAGKRKILMADLKTLYEKLGFSNVSTYIQSGNVLFTCQQQNSEIISQQIEEKIAQQYGFDVPVITRTVAEWNAVAEGNPFLVENEVPVDQLYVAFLGRIPSAENVAKLNDMDFGPDQYHIKGTHVFICYAEKYSKSKLTNNLLEQKLKVSATTRNWKTTLKLSEMGKQY